MSKAFDMVNRKKHFEHLETILDPDELHLLSVLANRPQISIKLNHLIPTKESCRVTVCLVFCLYIFLLVL